MSKFAANLTAARKAANLTQSDMAKKLSIARTTYTYYELGHTEPSLNSLVKISRILKVSVNRLLGVK